MKSFFYELPSFQCIAITGANAVTFLQGQVTCDIREVDETQTRRGAHCNPKGRVLSNFRVLQFQAGVYLLAPASMSDPIIQQLKKYAVFSKIELAIDHSLKVIGCVGAEIAETLAGIFGELPSEADMAICQKNLLTIRVQHVTDAPRFEIVGTKAAVDELLNLLRVSYLGKTDKQWRALEVNAGIPTIYAETSDIFTPHMLNYPELKGVSFKKGCYTGQEIIARTQYLGKSKRHMHRFSFNSAKLPRPGEALTNAEKIVVGIVVDAAWHDSDQCCLLAVMQDEAMGAAFYWEDISIPK